MTMRSLASTAITGNEVLVQAGYNANEEHNDTKEEVYKEIYRYLRIEGHQYWISSTVANINDLVLCYHQSRSSMILYTELV